MWLTYSRDLRKWSCLRVEVFVLCESFPDLFFNRPFFGTNLNEFWMTIKKIWWCFWKWTGFSFRGDRCIFRLLRRLKTILSEIFKFFSFNVFLRFEFSKIFVLKNYQCKQTNFYKCFSFSIQFRADESFKSSKISIPSLIYSTSFK